MSEKETPKTEHQPCIVVKIRPKPQEVIGCSVETVMNESGEESTIIVTRYKAIEKIAKPIVKCRGKQTSDCDWSRGKVRNLKLENDK